MGYGSLQPGVQFNRPGVAGVPMTYPGAAPVQPVRPQTGQLPPSLMGRLASFGIR